MQAQNNLINESELTRKCKAKQIQTNVDIIIANIGAKSTVKKNIKFLKKSNKKHSKNIKLLNKRKKKIDKEIRHQEKFEMHLLQILTKENNRIKSKAKNEIKRCKKKKI